MLFLIETSQFVCLLQNLNIPLKHFEFLFNNNTSEFNILYSDIAIQYISGKLVNFPLKIRYDRQIRLIFYKLLNNKWSSLTKYIIYKSKIAKLWPQTKTKRKFLSTNYCRIIAVILLHTTVLLPEFSLLTPNILESFISYTKP